MVSNSGRAKGAHLGEPGSRERSWVPFDLVKPSPPTFHGSPAVLTLQTELFRPVPLDAAELDRWAVQQLP